MKIFLYVRGTQIDITHLVDLDGEHKPLEFSSEADALFDSASFLIPSVDRDEIGTHVLDLSRAIPRNTLVEFVHDGKTRQYRIVRDFVEEKHSGTFSHLITAFDRKIETTGIMIPDITITQRTTVGNLGYSGSWFDIRRDKMVQPYIRRDVDHWIIGYKEPAENEIPISRSFKDQVEELNKLIIPPIGTTMLDLRETKATSDREYLDGTKFLLPGVEYEIDLNFMITGTQVLTNYFYNPILSSSSTSYSKEFIFANMFTMKIYAGNKLLDTIKVSLDDTPKYQEWYGHKFNKDWRPNMPGEDFKTYFNQYTSKSKETYSFNEEALVPFKHKLRYTPQIKGEELRISIEQYESKVIYESSGKKRTTTIPSIAIKPFRDIPILQIKPLEEYVAPGKTMEDYMDKLLEGAYLDESQPYTISEETRSTLRRFQSPEFTTIRFNLFNALQEVSDFLGAQWSINHHNEIEFTFIKETDKLPEFESTQLITGTNDISGYNSFYQLSTDNVVHESIIKENNLSARADETDNAKLTEDNVMIQTTHPIFKPIKVMAYLKGHASQNLRNPIDITYRVVTYDEWQTFASYQDVTATGKATRLKSNNFYYIPGEPGIYGLSYQGTPLPGFIIDEDIYRSIFETLSTQVFLNTGWNPSEEYKDVGEVTTNAFRLSIEYTPISDASVNIYKEDQSGFEIERGTFFNETSRLNDANLIGSVAYNTLNRSGGTEYVISGITEDLSLLDKIGYQTDGGYGLTKVDITFLNNSIRYTATLVKDYLKYSTYITKRNDLRLYEIPNTDYVFHNKKKRTKVVIGSTYPLPEKYSVLLRHLNNEKIKPPAVGEFNFYHDLGTSKVYTVPIFQNFATTASWKFQAFDNSSFGFKVEPRESQGVTYRQQSRVPYTDIFGQLKEFDVKYFQTLNEEQNTDTHKYPEYAEVDNQIFDVEKYKYTKDGREAFSFEREFSFISADPTRYILYPGIVKFNSFLSGNTDYDIRVAGLRNIPNKSNKYISPSDIIETLDVINLTVGSQYISFNIVGKVDGEMRGIAFYDALSNELLMVVNEKPSVATYRIPYGTFKELKEYKVEFFFNDGNDGMEIFRAREDSFIIPPTPKRDGYTFLGWYYDEDFTQKFSKYNMVKSDVQLFALWEEEEDGND